MDTPLSASANSAGSVLANWSFEVPQFQREYSWSSDGEVEEFWSDLKNSLGSEVYFLGLIILTDDIQRKHVVDGQQRLISITDYLKNRFPLPDAENGAPTTVTAALTAAGSAWAGKTFDELAAEDRDRLLGIKLQVVEMHTQDEDEVRFLFVRLQAGTPLTAHSGAGSAIRVRCRRAGGTRHRLRA